VALLDETVLSVPGRCRDFWVTSPLQLEFFGDNIAGEEFFRKLDTLLIEPEKLKEVLGIYYLCLSLGFEGKYRISNFEERGRIIDNLGRQLSKVRSQKSTSLSPHGQRGILPVRGNGLKRAMVPLWVVGVVAAVILGIVWGALTLLTSNTLQAVMQNI
jgi:type VI secretion system protein ImpK